MTDARFSHRDILNQGADRSFDGFPMVEMVVLDTINNTLKRATSDAMNHFGTNDIDSNANGKTYEGLEDSDGTWQVVEISKTGNVTSNRFATIKNNPTVISYSDAWAARTSTLVFDTYSVAM